MAHTKNAPEHESRNSALLWSINHHHYTGGHVLVQHKKTEHKTIQSGMKSLMRVFCSSVVVLSAIATKEATHPTMTGRPP